jgi:DHA1 family bicyclomycin/chloramphenicol resistance-like MFS transporter
MMTAMAVAPLLAPFIGGYVLVWSGWRYIFATLAAFGLLILAFSLRGLGESLPPERRPAVAWHQMAFGYLTLLFDRTYMAYALAGAFMYGGLFAYISGSPFVFIEIYGVAPEHYGLLFGLNVIGLMSTGLTNGRLSPRIGADRMLRLGTSIAVAAGAVLAGVAATQPSDLGVLLVPLFVFLASINLVGPNAMAGALAERPQMAGSGSALAGCLQFGLGVVAATAVGAWHDGTALPMAGVIAAMGLLSFVAARFIRRGAAAATV